MSLRILIVAHGHPELKTGGGEIAAYLLFQGLRRLPGVEAHFLAWAAPGPDRPSGCVAPFAGRANETVIATDAFDSFLLSQPVTAVLAGFTQLLRRLDPDIVHFHHYTNLGIEFIAAARSYKPALLVVLTLHEYLAICHHYGTMVKTTGFVRCEADGNDECAACFPWASAADFARRRRYIQSHFALVDRFIAPSEFLRQRYIAWGLPPARIVTIENGIAAVRPPSPRRRRAGEGPAVFGFFGQIHPFKGLIELLQAFDQLRLWTEATGHIRLVIHGAHLEANGADYIALFRELLSRTAARVDFAGPYAHQDLRGLMSGIDWVVVPSIWWENSPLVIEEALAHRRPVLCSNIGGMAEKVRPGKDGFHFPVGDAKALARLLARLAGDNHAWDELRRTMRRPATIAEAAARHLAIYRSRSVAGS